MKVKQVTYRGKKKTVKAIPQGSALKPFERFGVPGVCTACRRPVSAHFGHKGAWLGCTATGIDPRTPFFMVPARRRADIKKAADFMNGALDGPVAAVAHARRAGDTIGRPVHDHQVIPTRTSYAYRLADKRKKQEGLSEGWARVYKALRKASDPLKVDAIAVKAKRPVEATRITLNRMVEQKIAVREPIHVG